MQNFETILDEKIQTLAAAEGTQEMYTNFHVTNLRAPEEAEIDGEIMLLRIHDYIPNARSAIANVVKKAGKFVCHFEVWSEKELYIAEAASTNIKLCIQLALEKDAAEIRTQTTVSFTSILFLVALE